MFDVDDIAAQADVIIGGFAVLVRRESIKVVNLNTGIGAAVFTPDGTLVYSNVLSDTGKRTTRNLIS